MSTTNNFVSKISKARALQKPTLFLILLILITFQNTGVTQNPQQTKLDNASETQICDVLKARNLKFHRLKDANGNFIHLKLIQGVDGWIFHPNDFVSFRSNQQQLHYLKRLNSLLKSQEVTLVLLKLPQRGQFYSDYVADEYQPISFSADTANSDYDALIDSLNDIDILAPNLLSIFKASDEELLFYKADNHWTFKAQDLTAQAILEILNGTESFQDLEKSPYDFVYSTGELTFGTFGDWINRHCEIKAPSYPIKKITSQKESSEDSQNDLFSNNVVPVVLLGTSQSLPGNNQWDFSTFLEINLSVEVSNESIAGAEGFALLEYFVKSPNWLNTKPKFILWETDTSATFPIIQMRQILPATLGACPVQVDAGSNKFDEAKVYEHSFTEPLEIHPESFIQITVAQDINEVLPVKLIYQDGFEEAVVLGHPKIKTDGQYYLEFPMNQSALLGFSITPKKNSTIENVTWSICDVVR